MANSVKVSPQFRVNGGVDNLMGLAILIQPKSADLVGDSIGSAQNLSLNGKFRKRHMRTSTDEDNEVEEVYEQLDCLTKTEKGNSNTVVMGDWNCILGEGQDEKEVGAFGLRTRNERGGRLVEFCRQMKLVVSNTCFEHGRRRIYTWKQPGETRRHQLDNILVRQRFRNSVKNACSYPCADADSDHNLVVMTQTIKLKKLKRRRKKLQWDLQS